MKMTLQEAEHRAREIIVGVSALPTEVLELVLRSGRKFGLARKLLERVTDHPEFIHDRDLKLQIAQKHALCTYKDADLPADQKLEDADRILQAVDDLKTTANQQTLGLAGAIYYKRKWELTAQEQYLKTSLAYYYRGDEQGVTRDYGYTAINAAFVLDVLADLENVAVQPGPLVAATATQRQCLAKKIRQDIVATLPALLNQPDRIDNRVGAAFGQIHRLHLEERRLTPVTVMTAKDGDVFGGIGESFNRAIDGHQTSAKAESASGLGRGHRATQTTGPRRHGPGAQLTAPIREGMGFGQAVAGVGADETQTLSEFAHHVADRQMGIQIHGHDDPYGHDHIEFALALDLDTLLVQHVCDRLERHGSLQHLDRQGLTEFALGFDLA